jgi:hypothetical protein
MAFDEVGVITTDYSLIKEGSVMKQYVNNRVAAGRASVIYAVPHILDAYYTDGTDAARAIQDAIDAWVLAPTHGNLNTIHDKVALACKWLDGLVELVIPIANAEANATTREEASTNIDIIGLTPEKLTQSSKGTPETTTFTADYVGGGIIELDITNGPTYDPTVKIVIAVAMPPVTVPPTPDPVVALVNGQVGISSTVPVQSFTKTITGKGKSAKLYTMGGSPKWKLYIYTMNGNKLISLLSAPVPVTIFEPPV